MQSMKHRTTQHAQTDAAPGGAAARLGASAETRRREKRWGPKPRNARRDTHLTASSTGGQSGKTPAAGIAASQRPGARPQSWTDESRRCAVRDLRALRPSPRCRARHAMEAAALASLARKLEALDYAIPAEGLPAPAGPLVEQARRCARISPRRTPLLAPAAPARRLRVAAVRPSDAVAARFTRAAASRPGAHAGELSVAQAARRPAGARS